MIDQLKTQTPRHVAVAALVLTGLAFVLGGASIGIGAAVGEQVDGHGTGTGRATGAPRACSGSV